MRNALVLTAALGLAIGLSACKSSESGVKTSYRSQWTDVMANTEKTTDAAKAVLEAEGLKDIKAESTALDGKASAKKADGTKINVSVKKKNDKTSELTVVVGTMGDPSEGAALAKKIKDKAEGK